MVKIDYIFEADALRYECQHQDLVSDYTLSEREMLMQLRVGDVEVLGHTEREYQKWMEALDSNNVTLHVPSSAWSLLAVLSIAVSIDSAFRRLKEEGRGDIDAINCDIHMTRQDDIVMVYMQRDRIGQAPYAEVCAAFTSFAGRVRRDFLSVCPQLREHVTLGSWFRGEGEARSTAPKQSQDVVYLPPTSSHTSRD